MIKVFLNNLFCHMHAWFRKTMKCRKANPLVQVTASFVILIAAVSCMLTACALSDSGNGSTSASSSNGNSYGSSTGSFQTTQGATPSASVTDPSLTVTENTAPIDYSQIPVPVMDSPIKPSAHKLAFFSNYEQAVILGGVKTPYYIKGTFNLSESSNTNLAGFSRQTSLIFPNIYSQVAFSQDRESLIFMMNVNQLRIGDLMYFDGEKAVKIADTVSSFTYANDGEIAAYVKEGVLYKYDCRTGCTELVSSLAVSGYILSPNGDTIAYTQMVGSSPMAFYSTNGKKAELIAETGYPLAITNDGSTVYFTSYDEELSAMHDGKTIALGSYSSDQYASYLIFSRDCSQVVFGKEDVGSFFSDEGQAPVKISNCTITGLVGWQTDIGDDIFDKVITYLSNKNYYPQFADSDTLFNLPYKAYKVKDKDTDQNTDKELISFDESMNSHVYFIDQQLDPQVQRNGRAVVIGTFFPDPDSKTYVVRNYLDPTANPEIVDIDTRFCDITSSGTIYYVDDSQQIVMVRGTDSPVLIDACIEMLDSFDANGTTYLYYKKYANDQSLSLWCIEDKPDATPILIAPKIDSARICDFGVIYQTLDSNTGSSSEYIYNLYESTDGTNFTFVMKLPYSFT